MLSHKKSLDILRKTNALLEGHFVLSSGLHSPKYIQCAKLLSYPSKATTICKSLALKIKKKFKKIDLILAPAMGGIIIGYEIGRILNKETIFCERVKGKFTLRRGFEIKKGSKVLILEDVITTGKSSMECARLINRSKAKVVGFASIIDRCESQPGVVWITYGLAPGDKSMLSIVRIGIAGFFLFNASDSCFFISANFLNCSGVILNFR